MRVQRARRAEQVEPRHPRHPLIHKEERDRRTARREFLRGVESLRGGPGLHDAVVGPEVGAQVPFDGREHRDIVVHDEEDWLHVGLVPCFRCSFSSVSIVKPFNWTTVAFCR